MTAPAIRVDGARELQRALRQVADGTAELKQAHAEAAEVVADHARTLVPRRSGALGASIRSSGQAREGVVRSGRAAVPYAGPIHFGWPARNIAPQPFLYDALDERRQQVIDVYTDRVEALIDRHGL